MTLPGLRGKSERQRWTLDAGRWTLDVATLYWVMDVWSEELRTSGSSNMRWQLIGWLFLLSAISYLDRVNLSIAGGTLATITG